MDYIASNPRGVAIVGSCYGNRDKLRQCAGPVVGLSAALPFFQVRMYDMGPVVRKSMNANPGIKCYPGFLFMSFKEFFAANVTLPLDFSQSSF